MDQIKPIMCTDKCTATPLLVYHTVRRSLLNQFFFLNHLPQKRARREGRCSHGS